MNKINILMIGLGNFGLPIAKNLIASNYNIYCTLIDGHGKKGMEKIIPFGGKFIKESDFQSIDALILCLPRPKDVQAVIHKLRDKIPKVIIDLSTGDPTISRNLEKDLKSDGITYIDSPVSGSIEDARNGNLTLFAGTKSSINVPIKRILQTIGKNIYFFDQCGNGHKAKLINQLIHLSNIAIIGEAIKIAKLSNLDLNTLISSLKTASAGSKMLDRFGDSIIKNEFTPHFSLELANKDLNLLNHFIENSHYKLLFGGLVREIYKEKLDEGKGSYNFTIVCE
ncbi:hypothetical protein A6E21_27170 [Bacillus cereus]|nr:hypothetical protein A6E21_27170 [Bacillus cereus]